MGSPVGPRITKFTNCRLLKDAALVESDLWIDSQTGRILDSQTAFYGEHLVPDQTLNLAGKIISPGFIDVQLNGAYGFDFSVPADDYPTALHEMNRKLIATGVTSYLPTVTSQKPEVYHAVLPHLGPAGKERNPADGAESLGAHVEGPFLAPSKNGIHNLEVLRKAQNFSDITDCYGAENFPNITKMTAAPEIGKMISLIPEIIKLNIIFALGHSDCNFEEAQAAMAAGATMITHMFNAMRPFAHRDPGIFGLLGQNSSLPPSPTTSRPSTPRSGNSKPSSPQWSNKPTSPHTRPSSSPSPSPRSGLSICSNASDISQPQQQQLTKPYFGLIADGIHLHPSSLSIAYNAHPSGAILVTDALSLAGLADGTHDLWNGDKVVKKGPVLSSKANGRLAGSVSTLIECVNNFRRYTGVSWAEVLGCVTGTPAKMLGGRGKGKGKLEGGMDADLVVLEEVEGEDGTGELRVEQVWKFGARVS